MYGIFKESWVIFKDYCGSGFIPVIFCVALVYLLFSEKERWKRIVLVYVPMLISAAFFIPYVRIVFVALMDEGNTYYRLLWLIPSGIVIAYAGVSLFEKHLRIGLVVMTVVIVLGGSLVYRNKLMTKAENAYHIPQTVVNICDAITPEEGAPRIRAAFPSELTYFVRQYDTDIMMPFGREMVEDAWDDYYNVVYEEMEKPEIICMKDLLKATRETKCKYIILAKTRKTDEDPVKSGLELYGESGDYNIYEDPRVQDQ